MSIRRSIAAFTLATAFATFSMNAAEPAKGGGAAAGQSAPQAPSAPPAPRQPNAPAPSNNAPSNDAPARNTAPNTPVAPNAPTAPGQFDNAPGTRRGADNHGNGLNNGDRRGNQNSGRTVYVPGYGYSNWNGDYSSPYWSTPGTWYNNDGYSSSQRNTADNNNAAAPAQSTRPQEEAAQAEMMSSRTRLSKQFESSDEVRSALHDVQDAQKAYDAAVVKANRELKQNPDFKEANADKQQAARKVEAAQAADRQPAPTAATATQPAAPYSAEVVRAAQQKLNAASEVSAIQADHAQTNPAVTEAREKLEAAAEKLNVMKDKFDAALQSDPQWQSAKQKLDAARSGLTQ